MSAKSRRWGAFLLAALFAIGYAAVLFFPYPERVEAQIERYAVLWQDGQTSEESYAAALFAYAGWSDDGDIYLLRDGKLGTFSTGEGARAAREVLEGGSLGPMLGMNFPMTRFERTVLLQDFADLLYYDNDEFYAFQGTQVVPTRRKSAKTVFWTGGSLSASKLQRSKAERLILGDGAAFSADALVGSAVAVEGRERYRVLGGAIVDGERNALVGGVPLVKELTVPDVEYCEEGALLPCEGLTFLSLPFVGNRPVSSGQAFRGEAAYLFSDGVRYDVPRTLERIEVRGGTLVSHAFYGFEGLLAIDACGVDPALIDRDAFLGPSTLLSLHTPRADVSLPGNFTASAAPCGCTVYQRTED